MLLLAVYSFANTLLVEAFDHYPIPVGKAEVLVVFVLMTVGIWEGSRLWNRYLMARPMPFVRQMAWQFGGSLPITLVATLLPAAGLLWWRGGVGGADLSLPFRLLLLVGFRINLFLNIINLVFGYIQQLRQAQLEAEEHRKISAQAQLQAVRSQVNPHFLFNNFSVLTALIGQDPKAAIEFIGKLSKVYRYVLKSHEQELVPLTDELEFIRAYLFLLDKRFGRGLTVEVQIGPAAMRRYVVPVALQMLVENAVKHNIVRAERPLHVRIQDTNDGQTLVVENNLQLRAYPGNDDDSTGLGLSNIQRRYEFLTPNPVVVTRSADSFTVALPLLTFLGTSSATNVYETADSGR
jgi:two-component system, LytTR family, sensor kinase